MNDNDQEAAKSPGPAGPPADPADPQATEPHAASTGPAGPPADPAAPQATGPHAASTAPPWVAAQQGFEPKPGTVPEAVWTFRGYQLTASDFTTAMVHFFRAEISRANTWRLRLDATTNWAVITTGAAISIAFRSALLSDHAVIILNTLLVTIFLQIEARRYRYYELWSYRVRLMETDFYAAMLVPPFRPAPDWAETLAENLLQPRFPISMWEAVGRRFRRNYVWIYMLLGLAWLLKISIHPVPATSLDVMIDRATIGALSGEIVILAGFAFNIALVAMGIVTMRMQRATGEVLPRYRVGARSDGGETDTAPRSWLRPSRRRNQLVALVITDHPDEVGRHVLAEMTRGVTSLEGKGMYTGRERGVLLTALTVTEVKLFQAVVKEADPGAFVIVMPAQEIMGSGFAPLEKAEREPPGRAQKP